jgi:hypothetical protein
MKHNVGNSEASLWGDALAIALIAAGCEPQIPARFADLVEAIDGLNNTRLTVLPSGPGPKL